jgi:hypothetical protein
MLLTIEVTEIARSKEAVEFTILTLDEARVTMLCHKLYAQELKQECFVDKAADERWYQDDYHTMYIVEIEKILVQD